MESSFYMPEEIRIPYSEFILADEGDKALQAKISAVFKKHRVVIAGDVPGLETLRE